MLNVFTQTPSSGVAEGVLEIKSRADRPLEIRSENYNGKAVDTPIADDLQSRKCPAVRSILPNPEYQNELDGFRAAINAANKLRSREHATRSDRGTQQWIESVVVDDDDVLLDVTDCNHIPSVIYGQQPVGAEADGLVGFWEAVLDSVTTVRIDPHRHQFRRLAKYLVYLDEHEGRLARIDLSR